MATFSTPPTHSRAWRAPTATELKMQKPQLVLLATWPFQPAWCPGGRTTTKEFLYSPAHTLSMAWMTPPAALRAASRLPIEKLVSQVL